MRSVLTKSQVDLLGERLKKGLTKESDLRLLDDYRRSFGSSYERTISTIRTKLQLKPTGRPSKSTASIIDKLWRESIRLSQMQDIAGCRLVVPSILDQNRVVESLSLEFTRVAMVDRRTRPSHGYRAVHLVTKDEGLPIEIQVRSGLQHLWAELSEKLSDMFDASVKYGGGPEEVRRVLSNGSLLVARIEVLELSLADPHTRHSKAQEQLAEIAEIKREQIDDMERLMRDLDGSRKERT